MYKFDFIGVIGTILIVLSGFLPLLQLFLGTAPIHVQNMANMNMILGCFLFGMSYFSQKLNVSEE